MRPDVLVLGGGAALWPRRTPRYRQFPFHCSKRAVCDSSRPTGPAWAIHAAAASAAAGLVQRRAAARGRPGAGAVRGRGVLQRRAACRRVCLQARHASQRHGAGGADAAAGCAGSVAAARRARLVLPACAAGAVGAPHCVCRACGTGRAGPAARGARPAERHERTRPAAIQLAGVGRPVRRRPGWRGQPRRRGRRTPDAAGVGFAPEQVGSPVRLWLGEHDELVPARVWLERPRRFPVCDTTVVPGVGHFLIAEHMAEIVGTV